MDIKELIADRLQNAEKEREEQRKRKLTPDQINNWRGVFTRMGWPAFIFSDEEIQSIKDRFQADADALGGK